MNRLLYDVLYRFGAPWETGPRSELVELVESGRLSPASPGPRAVDLGCGSGANSAFLAEHGFTVTGIDFSPVALARAEQDHGQRLPDVRFVRGDLLAPDVPGVDGPFDLLVDYGTLDDLRPPARRRFAETVVRWSRPGSAFLLWCFYGDKRALPLVSFNGPSRLAAGLAHDEEKQLFGGQFDIEPLQVPDRGTHGYGCFLMTRRA
jgi:SAM-dependent methyltransferase